MLKSAPKTKVIEVPNEGPIEYLGKKIIVFGANYFWTGTLVGVNDTFIKIENPAIVYETGDFKLPKWKDEQSLNVTEMILFKGSFEGMALSK